MATPIPRAPPPSPHLLRQLPTLILPLRLRLAAAATAISQLNHCLRARVRRRDANYTRSASSAVDPAQAEAYLHMIREQQRLGLRQFRGDGADGKGENECDDGEEGSRRKGVATGSSLGHRVDPRELQPGEYVVRKKVVVGKFVCISGEDGVDYVFIQYADAMAKPAVDRAARMLYRYDL